METSTAHAAATGVGLATVAPDGALLDVFYPDPLLLDPRVNPGLTDGSLRERSQQTGKELQAAARRRDFRTFSVVTCQIASLNAPPIDVADVYLRLHLLSTRQVLPNSINLEGIFGILPNNAWTNLGPCRPEEVPRLRMMSMQDRRPLAVRSVDQIPRMTDYVVPTKVRIGDADRVRLGAYLAPGTVVMHEGFCNYNAGTLGASMVEGRISQGVVVGDGSDIGGGASLMGTLSGGGSQRVSLGSRCLIGANAGVGIPLGDDCIVEAGLYVTAGTKVVLLTADTSAPGGQQSIGESGAVRAESAGTRVAAPAESAGTRVAARAESPGGTGTARRVVTARELAGASGLLFRRNSLTGEVQALPHTANWSGLNSALHQRK